MTNAALTYVLDPKPLPLSGEDAARYLRDIEREHLDTYHQRLPLWSIDPSRAFFAALVAIDSFTLTMSMIFSRSNSVGVWQYVQACEEGFAVAMRWLYPRFIGDAMEFLASEEDISKAGYFLMHAGDYARLEMMHIAYGKGLYDVSACPQQRRIRFAQGAHPGARSFLHFGDLTLPSRRELATNGRSEELDLLDTEVAAMRPTLLDGRIQYQCVLDHLRDALIDVCHAISPLDALALRGKASMGSFTYDEFTRFWKVLLGWSAIASRLYLRLSSTGTSQSECMPTQVVPVDMFVDVMSSVARLEQHTTHRILDFLTFDNRTTKPDLFLQPLFRLGETVVWCPLVIWLSRQPRNALKLLCRTKPMADLGSTLNGTRERPMLVRFGQYLQRHAGYAFKVNVPLRVGDSETELDCLAYRSAVPNEVLLVQGKTPNRGGRPE